MRNPIEAGKSEEYPFFSGGFLLLQLLKSAGTAGFEGLELLFLEGPVVGDAGVLLRLLLSRKAQLLGLLGLLLMVLLHLPYDLVLLLQWYSLALAL